MNNERVHIYPVKLLNRLISIFQRNDTVQHALSYELTVVALSLFDNNLFMRKANKAVLGKYLKSLTMASTRPEIAHRVLDGGWLLHQVKWIEGDTWLEIADRYDLFCKKAAARVISPECLPPTRGSAAQHSLWAYSQNQDWLQLKSMSKDTMQYGYSIGERGYEPLTI